MNMRHKLTIAVLALVAAPVAGAATVDFEVKGTIVPPSCTIGLTNNGAIDLGQIDLATLNDAPNPLPAENIDVTVSCAAAVKVATSVTEDRSGSSMTAGDSYFGLGMTAGATPAPIGHYQVFGVNGLANTVAASVIGSQAGATWVTQAAGTPIEHGAGYKMTSVGTTAGGPTAITSAQWTMRIEPTLNSTSALALTGNQAIDGRMTLTLMYL